MYTDTYVKIAAHLSPIHRDHDIHAFKEFEYEIIYELTFVVYVHMCKHHVERSIYLPNASSLLQVQRFDD